jgi:hypothetical protein
MCSVHGYSDAEFVTDAMNQSFPPDSTTAPEYLEHPVRHGQCCCCRLIYDLRSQCVSLNESDVPELKATSPYVTRTQGGGGTARDVVELILTAQGRWKEAILLALA